MDTKKSLKGAFDLLFQFSKFAGLKPNLSKSKVILIEPRIYLNTICIDTGIQWTTDHFTFLGITYTANLKMEQLNSDNELKLIRKNKSLVE